MISVSAQTVDSPQGRSSRMGKGSKRRQGDDRKYCEHYGIIFGVSPDDVIYPHKQAEQTVRKETEHDYHTKVTPLANR